MEADRSSVIAIEDAILVAYGNALIRQGITTGERDVRRGKLGLGYKPIRSGCMPTLARVASDPKYGIKYIDLTRHQLDSEGYRLLAQHLMGNSTLRAICFNDPSSPNKFGVKSAEAWATLFASPTCGLEDVIFRVSFIDDACAIAMARGLKDNQSLKKLHMQKNPYGDAGVAALALSLAAHPSIQELDVGSPEPKGLPIKEAGAAALQQLLETTSLRRLDVLGRLSGDAGVKCIAAGLSKCTTIDCLCLNGNQISDGGIEALAQESARAATRSPDSQHAHACCICMYTRRVTYCDAMLAPWAALQALRTHKMMRILDLNVNAFGLEGAQHLAELIAMSQGLERLFLSASVSRDHVS